MRKWGKKWVGNGQKQGIREIGNKAKIWRETEKRENVAETRSKNW